MALRAVLEKMHTSFSHHKIGRTSGFPCTTDITAYSALSPGPTVPRRCIERLAARHPVEWLCLRATSTPAQGARTTRLRRPPPAAAVTRAGDDRTTRTERRPPHDRP